MGECEDIPIDEELDYGEEEANQYNSPELEYYEPDAFNHPDNLPAAFHVQDNAGHECRYCRSRFPSNNKLHRHLRGNCNRPFDNSMSESKHNTAHAFSIVPYSPETSESMERNNHIRQEIHSVKELKANLLVGTDITNEPVRKGARPPALFRKKRLKNLPYSRAAI